MATWRRALEVAMRKEDVAHLTAVSRSRTEPASRVQRAQMLLAYRESPSFFAVGQRVGVHHQTVQRCIERALAYGPLMALDDRPRPGKEPTITPEVKVLKKAAAKAKKNSKTSRKPVAIISYDEKPGIQAIATTSPDLPPVPGSYATFSRDHEYKRHGTLSLLAGIDLLTGKVHALVKDRHRSREFIEFLKLLNAAYPAGTAIKLILDNHSAHISRETKAWLATQPAGRFAFTFTPKHGSWLNLIEGFFSKFARSVLRHIRVTSKHELKERIMAGIDDVNRHPVIHTWSYKLTDAA